MSGETGALPDQLSLKQQVYEDKNVSDLSNPLPDCLLPQLNAVLANAERYAQLGPADHSDDSLLEDIFFDGDQSRYY